MAAAATNPGALSGTVLIVKNPAASWKLPFSAAELALLLQAMLQRAGRGGAGLELSLLDDPAMEQLNMRVMGCQGPTNILSFPAAPEASANRDARDGAFLGWLALSADTLLRESFLYGQDPQEHCIRLLAHGLAHLMGLDHGPEMDTLAREMEAGAKVP